MTEFLRRHEQRLKLRQTHIKFFCKDGVEAGRKLGTAVNKRLVELHGQRVIWATNDTGEPCIWVEGTGHLSASYMAGLRPMHQILSPVSDHDWMAIVPDCQCRRFYIYRGGRAELGYWVRPRLRASNSVGTASLVMKELSLFFRRQHWETRRCQMCGFTVYSLQWRPKHCIVRNASHFVVWRVSQFFWVGCISCRGPNSRHALHTQQFGTVSHRCLMWERHLCKRVQ